MDETVIITYTLNAMAECESRLFQIKVGCGGNTPSPGPTPTNPRISTMPSFPPGGLGAIALLMDNVLEAMV